MVEFALVVPVILLMIGGIVQFGVIFAAKNSLVQAARDTARWASTQTYAPCSAAVSATPPQPVTQADLTAATSGLIDYTSGTWNASNLTTYADNTPLPAAPPNSEGVEVVWSSNVVNGCPTVDNSVQAYVTVRLTHAIPVFLPGLFLLPGGACDGTGCHISSSATSIFRMEPPPP